MKLNGHGADYRCTSSETLPTEGIHHLAIAWEVDTNKFYYYDADAEEWKEVGDNA